MFSLFKTFENPFFYLSSAKHTEAKIVGYPVGIILIYEWKHLDSMQWNGRFETKSDLGKSQRPGLQGHCSSHWIKDPAHKKILVEMSQEAFGDLPSPSLLHPKDVKEFACIHKISSHQ